MWDNIVKFKNTIMAITFLIATAFTLNAYIAKATDLDDLRAEHRQDRLAYEMTVKRDYCVNLEMKYGCYMEGCLSVLPKELYKVYAEYRVEVNAYYERMGK